MFERRSALISKEPRDGTHDGQPLIIGEVRGFALVQVAAFVDTVSGLERALQSLMGVDLPKGMDTPSRAGGYCLFRVGPEQFWIVGPDDARAVAAPKSSSGSMTSGPLFGGRTRLCKVGPEQVRLAGPPDTWAVSLCEAIPPAMASVTSLAHARTRLSIEGPVALEVLSKGIALDLHPDMFQRDAYALTGLQDTPILLHRTGLQRYELYVLRTYAGWIWEWLTDAALPFGYDIVARSHGSMPGGAEPLR